MLTAKKSRWFQSVFGVYCRNLFRRNFSSFLVLGVGTLAAEDRQLPTIIYCNHSSWWDGLVLFQVSRAAKFDMFVMMEEKQLRGLPLFRKLGAFSIIRESPRAAVRSLNYAVGLLKEDENRTLVIFPQGRILPNDIRPIHFFGGIAKIIEQLGSCRVIPAAMRYEFLGNYRPEVFVKFGVAEVIEQSRNKERKAQVAELERSMTRTLDALNHDIIKGNVLDYESIL